MDEATLAQERHEQAEAAKVALEQCWDALADAKAFITGDTPDQPMSPEDLRQWVLANIDAAIGAARKII